jgi:hypothetical protein
MTPKLLKSEADNCDAQSGLSPAPLLGVVVETAKVYRAGGRRWFTKRAACRALAKQIINERCECEPDDRWGDDSYDITPGITCWYHKDHDRLEKIIRRMARIIMHAKTPNH